MVIARPGAAMYFRSLILHRPVANLSIKITKNSFSGIMQKDTKLKAVA